MTAKQISAVLFPFDSNDNKNVAYIRQLVLDLKNTLKTVGAESVLCHEIPCYRVNTHLLKCDYISYLETGKPEFHGEYMSQYSFAEYTNAQLYARLKK
jgi:two-component SAPR family response regulator